MEPTDVLTHRADARSAWRRAIGHVLRRRREQAELRLTDVARRAGVSPQYLSEVERGRKEASSEILATLCRVLDVSERELLVRVAAEYSTREVAVAATILEFPRSVGAGSGTSEDQLHVRSAPPMHSERRTPHLLAA
jgi:transcriptional regulator with XRE-family HTH domain